jgi:hypothetical protein
MLAPRGRGLRFVLARNVRGGTLRQATRRAESIDAGVVVAATPASVTGGIDFDLHKWSYDLL